MALVCSRPALSRAAFLRLPSLTSNDGVAVQLMFVRGFRRLLSEEHPRAPTLKFWRKAKGLPVSPSTRGPLTDLPDFSFVDGRPAPATHGQIRRSMQQRATMEKIVELLKEVEFAKKFHKDRLQAKEDEETFELQHSLIAKGGTSVDA